MLVCTFYFEACVTRFSTTGFFPSRSGALILGWNPTPIWLHIHRYIRICNRQWRVVSMIPLTTGGRCHGHRPLNITQLTRGSTFQRLLILKIIILSVIVLNYTVLYSKKCRFTKYFGDFIDDYLCQFESIFKKTSNRGSWLSQWSSLMKKPEVENLVKQSH
jgi:hypothetical protein